MRGVAKNAILAPVDPAAKHGLRLLKFPKSALFASCLQRFSQIQASLEHGLRPWKKKTNDVCICVFVCMVRFRIFREVKKAETARTHKHPYASYEFV